MIEDSTHCTLKLNILELTEVSNMTRQVVRFSPIIVGLMFSLTEEKNRLGAAYTASKQYEIFTICNISSDIMIALSLASSIEWCNREVVHKTRTEVVRIEGVDCLSDIGTVSTVDGSWAVLMRHILDHDRVPDIMINTSHIQRPGRPPGDGDRGGIAVYCQINNS